MVEMQQLKERKKKKRISIEGINFHMSEACEKSIHISTVSNIPDRLK